MTKLRIFIDLALRSDALDLLREGIAGHELIVPQAPAASVLAKGESGAQLGAADVVFGQPDTQAIAESTSLRWIHVSSAGITRYDTPAFRALLADRGIALTNSSSVYCEPCAEQVLCFMLAQSRNLLGGLASHDAGGSPAWSALRASAVPLRGQTALILGYGAIGRRLAEMLQPFRMHIFAYRRNPRGDEAVPMVSETELPRALSEADHVINILPESAETRRFFDAVRFEAIKPGAIFYNIGRGATVHQDALLQALRSGRIRAAWLDVTDPEPLPAGHPLRAQPNCFITPHLAGGHFNESEKLVRHFLANLDRFSRGETLIDRVI